MCVRVCVFVCANGTNTAMSARALRSPRARLLPPFV